jgi:hypothetical protein
MAYMPRWSSLAAPAVLLALCAGFYWKLALTDQYVWFDHPDMCYLEIPRVQFQAHEIHKGEFPLWDPRIWVGQPLIGQTQPGPLYPFNLLFALLPLAGGSIRLAFLNWYFVLIHFQAALFCYWLARDLERSRFASILAGCVFSFGGFLGSVGWLDVANGAVWTPLVALFLLRSVRGRSPVASAALGGFFLGLAWLCGHHEVPMLVSYMAAITFAYAAFRKGRPDWRVFRLAGVFFALEFLTGAAQMLPTFEFGRLSVRWIGMETPFGWKDTIPYLAHTVYSMPVRGVLGLAMFGVNQADSSVFTGALAVGLAVLGITRGWTRPGVRWLTVVGLGALVYALGAFTPLHGMFYSLAPMLGKARAPIRAIHLAHFSIAVLAAFGVDLLLEGAQAAAARRAAWLWAAFGGLIAGTAAVATVLGRQGVDERILLSGLASLGAAALIAAHLRGAVARPWVMGGLLALALAELSVMQDYPNRADKSRNKFVAAMTGHQDLAEYLRHWPGPIRVAVNEQDVPSNFGDWHGIDMLQGYVAGTTEDLWRSAMHLRGMKKLFAVNYWISREPEWPGQQSFYEGAGGVKVWGYPDAMPRAWASHEAVRVNGREALQAMIGQPDFDPRARTAFLDSDPPKLRACPAEESSVEITRYENNRVSMQAWMACEGVVVLADSFFPGWRATVDGRPAEVLKTWGALRGVAVGQGAHKIEMEFRPASVYVGGGLSLAGLLLAAAAWRKR